MKSPPPVKPKTSGAKIVKALNSNSSSSDNNKVLSSDEWGSFEAVLEKGKEDILDSRQMSQAPTTWIWLKQRKSHTYFFAGQSP